MSPISSIILAAGLSLRMGSLKQLLPLSGKPLIRHCLDTVLASGVCDIIVVVGFHGGEIAKAINELPLRVVFNKLQGSEMADSIRAGLPEAAQSSTGIIVYPCDYPLVAPETIATLCKEHDKCPDRIIIPVHNGKKGHPALFPRDVINEMFEGITLRDIMKKDPGRLCLVPVPDSGTLLEVDTREDYEKIVRIMHLAGEFPA